MDCWIVRMSKIMLIDLVDQLMWPYKSPVSSLRLLLLVALASGMKPFIAILISVELAKVHHKLCCDWTCYLQSRSLLRLIVWSFVVIFLQLNIWSLIMVIIAIDRVMVCCYLHHNQTCSFAIIIMIELAVHNDNWYMIFILTDPSREEGRFLRWPLFVTLY